MGRECVARRSTKPGVGAGLEKVRPDKPVESSNSLSSSFRAARLTRWIRSSATPEFCSSEESDSSLIGQRRARDTRRASVPRPASMERGCLPADNPTLPTSVAPGTATSWRRWRCFGRPFLSIFHLETGQIESRTKDGHAPNVAVTHLRFLGTRHTALVSADDRGMAFASGDERHWSARSNCQDDKNIKEMP
jgi:hypothetical protein